MITRSPWVQGISPVTSWPLTWNSGRPQKMTWPGGRGCMLAAIAQALKTSEPWVRMAIFGRPVVPPVQK
ncbi:hypothetical protein D3C80_1790120 [compost metagenome]